jgi:hypothetical protein
MGDITPTDRARPGRAIRRKTTERSTRDRILYFLRAARRKDAAKAGEGFRSTTEIVEFLQCTHRTAITALCALAASGAIECDTGRQPFDWRARHLRAVGRDRPATSSRKATTPEREED